MNSKAMDISGSVLAVDPAFPFTFEMEVSFFERDPSTQIEDFIRDEIDKEILLELNRIVMQGWCKDNLHHGFVVSDVQPEYRYLVQIEHQDDAMLFKLRHG